MKRFLFTSLLLTLHTVTTYGQAGRFGNEWIQYDQTHYRIPVTQQAVYRLITSDLQKAGLPVATINPATVQLFRRGVEQAIYVAGETDGRMDPDDYIEFVGQGNDGRQDSLLYRPMNAQPHPYYSLYSDTAAYFLTWRKDGKPGRRMAEVTATDPTGLSAEPYHLAEQLVLLTNEPSYNPVTGPTPYPTVNEVYFEAGEGWTGPMLKKDSLVRRTFQLTDWVRTAPVKPTIDVLLNGRDNTTHLVDLFAGENVRNPLATVPFRLFETAGLSAAIDPATVSATNELVVTTRSRGAFEEDRYSITYYRLTYPQTFSLKNKAAQAFQLLPNPAGRSLVVFTDVPDNLILYDQTDPHHPRRLGIERQGTRASVVVPNTETTRRLWASAGVATPDRLEPTVFRKLDTKPSYIIISHETLMKPIGNGPDPVRAYAAYRASAAGGSYDTLVVTMKQLYNQFSYGERTPLAIRRFADYLLAMGNPRFLLLAGRANAYFPIRRNPAQYTLDLVPTIGSVPGSDLLLTAGLAGYPDNVPAIPTGRINTLSGPEISQYLAKVREHESAASPALWRKQVLHLSGGRSLSELTTFRTILDSAAVAIRQPYWGGQVTSRSKKTDEPVERIDIRDVVNGGVSLITFFGHSSPVVTDLDFGYASKPTYGYANKARYPLMFFNGCGVGNIFFGANNNLSTDWLLTPNKGAIAILAHCFSGFVEPLETYTRHFYQTLFTDSLFYTQPIGVIQQEVTRRVLAQSKDAYDIVNAQEMVLQGDPAIRLFPVPKADLQLSSAGVTILPARPDSVRFRIVVANAGRFSRSERVAVRVEQRSPQAQSYPVTTFPAIAFRDTLTYAFKPDAFPDGTTVRCEIQIDPANWVEELDETNNTLGFDLRRDTSGYVVMLPDSGQRFPPDRLSPLLAVTFDGIVIPDYTLVSASPRIQLVVQDEDPYRIRRDTVGIDVLLRKPCPSCDFSRVSLNSPEVSWQPAGADNRFVLTFQPQNLADGVYTLQVQATDGSGNRAGLVPYEIHFRVQNEDSLSVLQAVPNPVTTHTRFRFTLTGAEVSGDAQIWIWNPVGQLVRVIQQPARVGENLVYWDGTSSGGHRLPNGVYLYQLLLNDGRKRSGKVILAH